jgi:hypothetical protein
VAAGKDCSMRFFRNFCNNAWVRYYYYYYYIININWKFGLPVPNCHYYSKLKREALYTSTCLLRLTQSIETNHNNNPLDLVFVNFDNRRVSFVDMGMVKPDLLHSHMVIDIDLRIKKIRTILSILIVNLLMETTTSYATYFQITTGLKCVIIHQWMLPWTVSILLCVVLWISLFLVVSSEKPNNLLGFLPP